jgi:hypothetical protein
MWDKINLDNFRKTFGFVGVLKTRAISGVSKNRNTRTKTGEGRKETKGKNWKQTKERGKPKRKIRRAQTRC